MEHLPENNNTDSIFDVSLDEQSRSFLLETCRWGKFLSILGIIFSAIIILAGVVVMIIGSTMDLGALKSYGPIIGLIYAAFGALYFYPSWKLMSFSSDMPAGLRRGEQHLVTAAFGSLKSSFRYWGISTLVIIGLYVIGVVVVVVSKM